MTAKRADIGELPNWPRLLSREQAAAYVGLSPNQFVEEVSAGALPAAILPYSKVNEWRWDRDELAAALLNAVAQPPDGDASECLIYFVRAGDGPIKIGITNTIRSRLRVLQSGHYEELSLLLVIEGTPSQEALIHHRFSHLHIRGEWFTAGADLLAFIDGATERRFAGWGDT
jgi:hypothetical protein